MADVVELEERLTRLENRIKTNFFDIEKKFADLSQKPEDERLHELEDLVLLIQLENTKLKDKLGTQDTLATEPGVMGDRVSKLESAIGELKSVSMPANVEKRLLSVEQLAKQMPAQATADIMTPKEVADNIAKINAARIELDNSLSKFRSLKDEIEKGMAEKQSLFSRLEQAGVDVEKAGAYFARMRTSEEKASAIASKMESLNEGMDAKIKAGTEKVELIKRDMENRFIATEDKFKARLEKLDAVMESLDVKSRGIDEKIDELQAIGKDLADVAAIKTGIEEQALRTASLERNLANISKRLSDIHKMKEAMEEELSVRGSLERKIQDLSVSIGALNNVNALLEDESASRMAMESRLQDVIGEMAGFRAMKAEIEKTVNAGLKQVEEKIKSADEEELSVRASLEKKIEDVSANLNSLGTGVELVNTLGSQLEEEATLRQGMESRLHDVISEMPKIRSAKDEIAKAVVSGMQAVEQKIQSMHPEERFEELNASVEEQLSAFDRKMADMQQEIEAAKEPVTGAKEEIEKAAQEKLSELAADAEELKEALHLDEIRNIRNEIAEHRKVIQNLKADLEIAASRFFTNNLEEFARALDRKFPGFVSREEYSQHLNQLTQRLKTIEAPDLSPLATRVGMLEKKLEDVHAMMQSLVRTMPIVVE